MNRRLHAGAVALACLGVLLAYAGWLGWTQPSGDVRAPGPIMWCGDPTCGETHP